MKQFKIWTGIKIKVLIKTRAVATEDAWCTSISVLTCLNIRLGEITILKYITNKSKSTTYTLSNARPADALPKPPPGLEPDIPPIALRAFLSLPARGNLPIIFIEPSGLLFKTPCT